MYSNRNIILYLRKNLSVGLILGFLLILVWGAHATDSGKYFSQVNPLFYYFLIGGFIFAMIDGAIGMSYGLTSNSFSLAMGIPPGSASMGVHLSEILSNGIAGWMHYKMKNINWKLFNILVLPGLVGAVLGAYLLSSLKVYTIYFKLVISIYMLFLGISIIVKVFGFRKKREKKIKWIFGLGFFGGFVDAIGGGGWATIVLSSLIAGGRSVIFSLGTIKLVRLFIAIITSLIFIILLKEVYMYAVMGLVIGSAMAAPIAAKVSDKISAKIIMIAVGVFVICINIRSILLLLLKM